MTELGRKALKGDQNQCPTCGAYFTTTSGFERHRLGSFNDPEDPRRCVDPSTRKMHLNSAGDSLEGLHSLLGPLNRS